MISLQTPLEVLIGVMINLIAAPLKTHVTSQQIFKDNKIFKKKSLDPAVAAWWTAEIESVNTLLRLVSEQLDFYFARVETGQPNILNTHPVIFQGNRVNTEKPAAASYCGATEWAQNLSPVPRAPPSDGLRGPPGTS